VPGHRVGRLLDQRDEQLLLGADIVVERGAVDADLDGDIFEAGARETLPAEDLASAFEDGLPPLTGGPAIGIAPFVAPTCVVALLAYRGNRSSSSCISSRFKVRHQARNLRKGMFIYIDVDVVSALLLVIRGHLAAARERAFAEVREGTAHRRWPRSRRPTRTRDSRCPKTSTPPTCARNSARRSLCEGWQCARRRIGG
jgi:hypothetical protein